MTSTPSPRTRLVRGEAIALLAHPVRLELLGLLRRDRPATASELARATGESSGTTSYHLRQLAAGGFVELDPEQPNRRDKRWRAVDDRLDVDPDDIDDAGSLEAVRQLAQVQVQRFARRLDTTLSAPVEVLWPWRHAVGSSDADGLELTPTELQQLRDEMLAVLERWSTTSRGRQAPGGSRPVTLYLGAVPELSGPST